ncbi:reverse transcriptase [Fusarium oxysporum f. sp. phaseoli]
METVEHFLFRCRKWTAHKAEMLQCTETRRGNLSFYLGGKSPSGDARWTPDMQWTQIEQCAAQHRLGETRTKRRRCM